MLRKRTVRVWGKVSLGKLAILGRQSLWEALEFFLKNFAQIYDNARTFGVFSWENSFKFLLLISCFVA